MAVGVGRWWFRFVFIVGLLQAFLIGAQNGNRTAATDPFEARALNSMFARWGIMATSAWNISGELFSGAAIDATQMSDKNLNPGIKRVQYADISGPLPDELWSLTFMIDLNLGGNYLTGPIPSAIGNLTSMQYLNFGINFLSGPLPSALGQLTSLIVLGIGTNNFTGPFPPVHGNLTKLTEIYFDSSGMSGAIPETFTSLKSLQIVWGSDNDLIGWIPTFIGNWSDLRQIRLQGNLFQGPIPSSFANLTKLTDLRISDVVNVTSSLNFLQNLTSLSTIVLRNNYISGSIPDFFNSFQGLLMLDLSFNNLPGSIPNNVLTHSSLINLYLSNNSLTGALPSQKSQQLLTYVSYNELSGSFPAWINVPNLQLNLVAINFSINSSSASILPRGLECLQRNFAYSKFAIKCGGQQMKSSDGTGYDTENETLGPATYYMAISSQWAVRNVGLPSDNKNPQYQTSSLSQFTNTLDSELFQTSRISAGSLRYYGLGLENGSYTVKLQFAESIIVGTKTWKSLGRRIFDVYIQGNLLLRDFDIQREAGDISNQAVVKEFTVEVLDHYIEIHLFWAGKGTCCVPAQGTYGPLISVISATPNFVPSVVHKKKTGLIVGVVVGVVASFLFLVLVCFTVIRRRRRKNLEQEELLGIDHQPYTFSYSDLKTATNDFNVVNKLGEGGFGSVYKGTLVDGRDIAVKLLSTASRQGHSQFIAEIVSISAVQHRNLVKLYGCCIEGDKRILIYEFLENKSLDKILFADGDTSLLLNWETRYNICLGIARGLYLHEGSRIRIVHGDVKASNILLDSDLTPKISDFGLAKLYDDKETHMSTRVAGTIGYLAPEYAMRGHLTKKADVFSYGVVAMEIVSGRPISDKSLEQNRVYLLEWAWKLRETNKELELVDPTLQEYNSEEVTRVIDVALLCTQTSPALRPSMSRVVAMLSGDIEVAPVNSCPAYLTDWMVDDDASAFLTETECSTSNAANPGSDSSKSRATTTISA